LSNAESESDCAIRSDNNMGCVVAEPKDHDIYPLQVFTQTNILIIPLCIVLQRDVIIKICHFVQIFNEWVKIKSQICVYLRENSADVFKTLRKILSTFF
jgi:hypothetical protein